LLLFLLFVTFINYFLLLRKARVYIVFIVRGGKGYTLIFFLFFFFTVEGEGDGGECFFLLSFDVWKVEGKGMIIQAVLNQIVIIIMYYRNKNIISCTLGA
jgi:hypothetical protein